MPPNEVADSLAKQSARNVIPENNRKHARFSEHIRKKIACPECNNWTIGLSYVKAHTGTFSNELADFLAKQAARKGGANISKRAITKKSRRRTTVQQ